LIHHPVILRRFWIHYRFLDISSGDRFFGRMKSHVPPDALRAARTLLRLSQRALSEQMDFSRKSISSAENAGGAPYLTVVRLRDFFEDRGLQFLGTIDIDTGTVCGAGVRWRTPDAFPPEPSTALQFHTESDGVSFEAARSLLGVGRSTLSKNTGIKLREITALEARTDFSRREYDRLRDYYDRAGIEFMGWGDVQKGWFYGVGVRWKPSSGQDTPYPARHM
jgi:transcriptional regulator with XRE-family HTH domain